MVPGLWNPQAHNRYAYVLNDPIGYADPTGHWPQWMSDAWNAVTSAGSATWGYASGAASAVYGGARWAGTSMGSMLATGYEGARSFLSPATYSSSSPSAQAPVASAQAAGAYRSSQSGVSGASATDDSGGPIWIEAAGSYLEQLVEGEALEIAGGLVGTPEGILRGLYGIGRGLVTADLGALGGGFVNVGAAAIMIRSGSASGLLHPGKGAALTPDTGTKLNNASLWHDGQRNLATSSAAQFGWIQRAWFGPGTELGPWGQAYRIYGTVGFGIIGAGQAVLGH